MRLFVDMSIDHGVVCPFWRLVNYEKHGGLSFFLIQMGLQMLYFQVFSKVNNKLGSFLDETVRIVLLVVIWTEIRDLNDTRKRFHKCLFEITVNKI